MTERRRGLGRGLGALIPTTPQGAAARPVDVFWPQAEANSQAVASSGGSDPAATFDSGDSVHEAGQPLDAAEETAVRGKRPDEAANADQTADEAKAGDPAVTADQAAAVDEAGESMDTAEAGAGAELAEVPGATYAEVPLDAIRPNPKQPRTAFDQDELAELVASIQEIGVLQPVVVRPVPADGEVRYELVMGERRWRASRAAGRTTVPAIIKVTEDVDLLRDALLENLHRSQLNPLEEAAAYQQLLDDFGCTQEQLATRIGRSRPQISNTLRLLRLPPLVARRVAAGVLSAGHARALLTLDDAGEMERLAQRIVAEGLSVRNVEEIVAAGAATRRTRRASSPRPASPELEDLANRLSDRLDTRAKIQMGQRKGRVTIEFASVDDLHRIIEQMGVGLEP